MAPKILDTWSHGVILECGQVCEYFGVVTILIRLHLIRLYFSRLEGDIPSEADTRMLVWKKQTATL